MSKPNVVGGPERFRPVPFAALLMSTVCPHRAWFSQDYMKEILDGEVDTICADCALERYDTATDSNVMSETTLRHLEDLGMSRHIAYTLLNDLLEEGEFPA